MENIKELVGIRLKELRKNKGLSQAELSEIVNVDSKHISRLETGKTYPGPETLDALAKALDVPVKEFYEFQHFDGNKVTVESIQELLRGAGEEKLTLIYRIVKAVLR